MKVLKKEKAYSIIWIYIICYFCK